MQYYIVQVRHEEGTGQLPGIFFTKLLLQDKMEF